MIEIDSGQGQRGHFSYWMRKPFEINYNDLEHLKLYLLRLSVS